jgi:hypothetical protein
MLVTACGGSVADPTQTPAPVTPSPTPIQEVTTVPDPTPSEQAGTPVPDIFDDYPQPVVAAIDAAAGEADVNRNDVRILSYEEREWPSTALGCPQPGFSYAQVVTPGYLVLLQADGTEFTYHTNLTTGIVLCSRT